MILATALIGLLLTPTADAHDPADCTCDCPAAKVVITDRINSRNPRPSFQMLAADLRQRLDTHAPELTALCSAASAVDPPVTTFHVLAQFPSPRSYDPPTVAIFKPMHTTADANLVTAIETLFTFVFSGATSSHSESTQVTYRCNVPDPDTRTNTTL